MEMQVRGTGSIRSVARIVGKRLAPLALSAFMLGIVAPGFASVEDAAAMRKAGGDQEFAVAQDVQQASSNFEPNGDATTIVLEDAVNSDWPPGPSIIAIL